MVDCVVLAAGEGSRLRGRVARGMKPLILIEGEPLIARIVRQAEQHASRIVVVVSPINAQAITDVLGSDLLYALQPTATGPGDALRRGLALCRADRTLVLVGDNVISDADLKLVVDTGSAIGVRKFAPADPYLTGLTRKQGKRWVEKVPLNENETGIAWTGPLVIDTESARRALDNAALRVGEGELLIGPLIEKLYTGMPREVHVVSVDVGDGSWKL